MSLFPYSMTTLVPSASPRILSCIQKQNTFRSNIILLENKSLKRISNLSMLVQKNKFLIPSLNLYLVKHLNTFARSLGFSQVLIRLQVCRMVVCQGDLPFAIDVKGGENVVGRGVMIAGGVLVLPSMLKGEIVDQQLSLMST